MRVADPVCVGHRAPMDEAPDDFEQAARIVEAFVEGEHDDRVLELLGQIADAIRDRAIAD